MNAPPGTCAGSANHPGVPEFVPVLGDRPAARLVQKHDLADLALVDPGFQIGEAQPHHSLKRETRDARRLHRVDHAIRLCDVHRHGLPEDDVLPLLGASDRQLRELRDGSREMDDVDMFLREQLIVAAVSFDAERAGERIQLRLVVPGRRDQLRLNA
jgi:hypothetical protein